MIIQQRSVFLIIITRIFKLFVINKILKYENIFTFIKVEYFKKSNIKLIYQKNADNNIKDDVRPKFLFN